MAQPIVVTDEQLIAARDTLIAKGVASPRAMDIVKELSDSGAGTIAESTVRIRFIQMGKPLSSLKAVIDEAKAFKLKVGKPTAGAGEQAIACEQRKADGDGVEYPEELRAYIPTEKDIEGYIERDSDARLDMHYRLDKHPITQGKQGTGKTFSHIYYAFKHKIPCMLISCFEDLVLHKFFGDKTIKDGSIVFREGILTKMIQYPSLILFDEINAVSNAKSFDFHALLQNRELFVKDADDGKGRTYKLHPKCRIGFAQNPRSAKYVGGVTKPSSFLGRCTYITFPDFTKDEIVRILRKRFPKLEKKDALRFATLFFEATNYLITNAVNVDISIRQIINVVEFYVNGMPLKQALNDGLIDVLDSISDPAKKEGLVTVTKAIFKELSVEENPVNSIHEEIIDSAKQQTNP